MTKDYLDNPSTYSIGQDGVLPISSNMEGGWKYQRPVIVPLHKDEKGVLAIFLLKRNSAAYVNIFIPKAQITIDDRLKEQMSRLSKRNLGRDVSLYPEYLGATITACYNPQYSLLDLT